jgi:hypothetical protein
VTVAGDCDDGCASCLPGGVEICDDHDNDCDGDVDEGLVFETYYRDADGDGYGDAGATTVQCASRRGWSLVSGDCDDTCPSCLPGGTEVCDGVDNDCDGEVDEGAVYDTYYSDGDGDGWGVESSQWYTCDAPAGWVLTPGDCNDACWSCFPGGDEVCDELDNDCDGEVDEGLTVSLWFDGDGDGYGNPPSLVQSCEESLPGYIEHGGDCHDRDPEIHPGAEEICDGYDNDCDGELDEGFVTEWYPDRDGDGYGENGEPEWSCEAIPEYVNSAGDCDDAVVPPNPGAEEIAGDGVDNDCDGEIDENGGAPDADADVDADAAADADVDADADAGVDAGADADAGGDSDGEAVEVGCNCRAAAGAPGDRASALLLLAALAFVVRAGAR